MPKPPGRTFSHTFKLRTVERMRSGEVISSLAREIAVHRQLLYKWRDAFRLSDQPRRRGRPSKAEALARAAGSADGDALDAARLRIAELERKVGRQALELDFFQQALRRIEASRRLR
ncbi:MAG: transposase [Caulobacteraceae bacterium]